MLTVALLLWQNPVPAAPPASPEIVAIRNACAKLAEAASYTVQQTQLDEGGGFGGPPPGAPPAAGGEGAAPSVPPAPTPVIFTAQVQKGKPTHFMQDKLEAWREGDALVYRSGAEAWARLSPPQGGQGGGGQAGGGGPQNQDPEAARAMRARMNLATTQVAHELMAGMDTKIAMAAAAKDGAKTVITGSLTPEGAASLGRRFGRRNGGQGGGGGGGQGGAPAVENSGTFRCVIAADGTLESMVFDTLSKGSFNDTPYERKRHVELRVSAVGATAVEVPAEVAAKIAEKPRDPSKEF